MPKPRSDLLGALGKLFAIFKLVVDQVLDQGGSDEDIARIGTDDNLAKDIAALICGKATVSYLDEVFTHRLTFQNVVSGGTDAMQEQVSSDVGYEVEIVDWRETGREHGEGLVIGGGKMPQCTIKVEVSYKRKVA